MGKSGKKIKSDRINNLRKQYDAFLEEDKKRKDRNEYILERLDKMRYCTSVGPLRNMLNTVETNRPLTVQSKQMSVSKDQSLIPNSPVKYYDQSTKIILAEISKQYILIPRRKLAGDTDTYYTEEPVKFNVNDNESTDWKRKYEILGQLKTNEKESCENSKENPKQSSYDHTKIIENNELSSSYEYSELPEKDICDNKDYELTKESSRGLNNNINYEENYNQSETIDQIETDTNQDIYQSDCTDNNTGKGISNVTSTYEQHENGKYINIAPIPGQPSDQDNMKQELKLQSEHEISNKSLDSKELVLQHLNEVTENVIDAQRYEEYIEPTVSEYEQQNQIIANEDKNLKYNITESENINILGSDMNTIQMINPNEIVKEIKNETPIINETHNLKRQEYPIDFIDYQQFTPKDDVILQNGVNINPENFTMNESNVHEYDSQKITVTKNPDNTDETSGIEEFDAEQREMFYSEENDQKYDTYVDNVNAEPSSQNENEQYVYYEGAQQDYPEINEHEESSQRYDQSYEQQFVNYEQQHEYNQEQYDQQVTDTDAYLPNQQEYNESQQEQENYETIENVEQELDHEQGYNNIEIEQNEIKNDSTEAI